VSTGTPPWLTRYWVAQVFLTRLPAPHLDGYQDWWLVASTSAFPLVGAVVGMASAAALLLTSTTWGGAVPAFVAIATAVVLTGAFHEDGLADALDGLGGHRGAQAALEIMQDSRLGTYGAVALLLVLGLEAALLAQAPPDVGASALVAAHVLGRWSSLPLLRALPYRTLAGPRKRPPLAPPSRRSLAAGTLIALALAGAALAAGGLSPGPPLAASTLVPLACGAWLRRRLGGVSGDALGMTNKLTQLAVLAVATA
jgi:adenosylcobinamide-GDP ribazoletransferase